MLPSVTILGKEIYLYGVCILLGVIALAITVRIRRIQNALLFKDSAWFYYSSFLGMLVGAKLIGFISIIPTVIHEPSLKSILVHFDTCPIVFYGGLLGALLGGFLCVRIRKINLCRYFNTFIPVYPLFHVFGRIGCYFGGCCYGIPCSWGFAMASTPDVKRLPIQLIEAVFELVVFFILIAVDRKKLAKHNLTVLYLSIYAPFRFIAEFFRGDEIRGFFGPFSTSQWISLIIIFVLLFLLTGKLIRKYANHTVWRCDVHTTKDEQASSKR